MIASVPQRVLDSARHELRGRAIVRSWVERTARGSVYELAGGGSTPRLVEVDPDGRLVYTEELFDERELPRRVSEALSRMAPHAAVVFVKQERLNDGGADRYEILVAEGDAIREVEIDSTGRLAD
jgi:hypothetical protein